MSGPIRKLIGPIHKRLIEQLQHESPISKHLWRNLYVDNVFLSASTFDEAKSLYFESKKIFSDASMNLREFISNNEAFNQFLQKEGNPHQKSTKILGIKWNNICDILSFSLPTYCATVLTKRSILKFIASIYDPLGLISPILVLPKLFLQKLWKTSLSWDDDLTNELEEEWFSIIKNWDNQIIPIKRLIDISHSTSIQLHCFVDASGHTYGAVAYLRMVDTISQNISIRIICSKNRLCPIKGMTIPKLELMALVIGARVIRFLLDQLDCTINSIFIWSDSSCALQWLNSSKDLTVFIKNRKVPEHTVFGHLSSPDNPADIISRGSTPYELINSKLWWEGPPWLQSDTTLWPNNISFTLSDIADKNDETKEHNFNALATTCENKFTNFINSTRYSSFNSLLNVICHILFFILKCSKNS
uniref:Pao retrotransposon peptidase family protein n=1 Tax=Heterorhabditis bacteriophora TaxID=37862 RepID=A0A1I7WCU0_HETBA